MDAAPRFVDVGPNSCEAEDSTVLRLGTGHLSSDMGHLEAQTDSFLSHLGVRKGGNQSEVLVSHRLESCPVVAMYIPNPSNDLRSYVAAPLTSQNKTNGISRQSANEAAQGEGGRVSKKTVSVRYRTTYEKRSPNCVGDIFTTAANFSSRDWSSKSLFSRRIM
jgi:hypothetical protein